MHYLAIKEKHLENLMECNPEFCELHEEDLEEFIEDTDLQFPLGADDLQFPELCKLTDYCKSQNLEFYIIPSIDSGLTVAFYSIP